MKDYTYSFGCCEVVISDQGREFVNKVKEALFELTGTKHRVTSAYHPQTNGLTERCNQTLQTSLLKVVNDSQNDWNVHLPPILFAYRTSQQRATKLSPFEIMYCRYMCMYMYMDINMQAHAQSLNTPTLFYSLFHYMEKAQTSN